MVEPTFELLKPGQIFAERYRVERFLAQGGHGAVFAAEQLSTEATVALKVLWPHLQNSADVASRFELEAKVAGRVKSEFIVRMLDAGLDEQTGMLFLVMEFLEGESLAEHVRQNGPLSLLDATTYIVQVAHGLDRAHSAKSRDGSPAPIIHRDLKPENLFLSRREDGQRLIKILDFGIAKVVTESVQLSQDIKATPLYMACEQASGDPITPRTDIWALGLVAFFMLTGRCYWKSATGTVSLIFAEVLQRPIVPPTERALELGIDPPWPPAFDGWFLRCVNRDPEQRFESAGTAASALAEALLGDALAVTLPSSGFRFDSIPPSVSRGLISGRRSSVPPQVSTTTVPTTVTSTAARDTLPAASEVRSRRGFWLGAAALLLLGVLAYFGLTSGSEQASTDSSNVPATATANGSHAPALSEKKPSETTTGSTSRRAPDISRAGTTSAPEDKEAPKKPPVSEPARPKPVVAKPRPRPTKPPPKQSPPRKPVPQQNGKDPTIYDER